MISLFAVFMELSFFSKRRIPAFFTAALAALPLVFAALAAAAVFAGTLSAVTVLCDIAAAIAILLLCLKRLK